jgi:ubiquinone biosynthesis monooxygenase Coq7
LRELLETNAEKHTEILEIIKKFRDEEQDHHDLGLEHEAEKVQNAHYIHLI